MGTVFSIDLRDSAVDDEFVDQAFRWLHEVDARFSPFKEASEITRLGRGTVTVEDCHPDVASVLALCEDLRGQTGGVFNAWRSRRDGRLDPSGVVKGWAVDRVARILERAGARNFCINAGGDVLARGEPFPGAPWRIGIRNPDDAETLAAVIQVTNLAVATSGSYERGAHIVDARTGRVPDDLRSLTVVGPSMTRADAYATVGFAMGLQGISWVASLPGYTTFAVTSDGRARYSDAFATLLA